MSSRLIPLSEGDTGGVPVPPFDYMKLKTLFGGVVIANNGFDKVRANEALAKGRADLIAFGKLFIARPSHSAVSRRAADAGKPRNLLWRN